LLQRNKSNLFMRDDAPTFSCYDDPVSDDATAAEMRAQLRSMYQWIDGAAAGEPNVQIIPPRDRTLKVMRGAMKAAANELQDQIQRRALDDMIVDLEKNAPGYIDALKKATSLEPEGELRG
jgi:hypothetical protein